MMNTNTTSNNTNATTTTTNISLKKDYSGREKIYSILKRIDTDKNRNRFVPNGSEKAISFIISNNEFEAAAEALTIFIIEKIADYGNCYDFHISPYIEDVIEFMKKYGYKLKYNSDSLTVSYPDCESKFYVASKDVTFETFIDLWFGFKTL